MEKGLFKGLITAMVTPFASNVAGGIDKVAVHRLVDYLIANDADGLFIIGTNGESYMMSTAEKMALTQATLEATEGRVPIYVGAGGNSTLETVEVAQVMAKLPIDAISVITPYFQGLTEEELYIHYKTVAESVDKPILLYNIPKRTGNDLSTALVERLAKLPNIKGIKDSSGSLDKVKDYLAATESEDFNVLSGSDGIMVKSIQLGSSGVVSGTSNVITKLDHCIVHEAMAGNYELANQYHEAIQRFRQVNHLATEPAVIKQALKERGIDVGEPRRPILPPNQEVQTQVHDMMIHYQQLERELMEG